MTVRFPPQIRDKREKRKDVESPLATYRAKRIAVASRLAASPLLDSSPSGDTESLLSSLLSFICGVYAAYVDFVAILWYNNPINKN